MHHIITTWIFVQTIKFKINMPTKKWIYWTLLLTEYFHNRRIFPYLKMNLIGCICIHAWIQPFNEINRHVIIKYILHIPRPWRSRSISIILMEEMMDEKKISVLDTRFHRPRLHKPSLIVHLKESHIEIFSSRID
jgi:hypothetical protein